MPDVLRLSANASCSQAALNVPHFRTDWSLRLFRTHTVLTAPSLNNRCHFGCSLMHCSYCDTSSWQGTEGCLYCRYSPVLHADILSQYGQQHWTTTLASRFTGAFLAESFSCALSSHSVLTDCACPLNYSCHHTCSLPLLSQHHLLSQTGVCISSCDTLL